MKLFRSIKFALFVALALCLGACESLQIQKPQSVEDSLQYAKGSLSAAYRTLGDAAASGQVTQEKGRDIYDRLGKVKADLALAEKVLAGGKPNDALSTINLALTALVAIRNELAPKKAAAAPPRPDVRTARAFT